MFHTWYGSRTGTRFMTFLFHHMFDSIFHLSTSVLVHLLLWWVKLLDYQVNKYTKWRQSWVLGTECPAISFWVQICRYWSTWRIAKSNLKMDHIFIALIFWRRVFQWRMPTVLAGTTTKTTPKSSLKYTFLSEGAGCVSRHGIRLQRSGALQARSGDVATPLLTPLWHWRMVCLWPRMVSGEWVQASLTS